MHTSPLVRYAPSLAPARSLPRSLSRSLAHTHARTRRRGSPSRARSPSGSSGRPPGSGLARPPAPGLPLYAAPRGGRTGGSPGPLPEVRTRGAAGGAAGSLPRGGCPAGGSPLARRSGPAGGAGGEPLAARGAEVPAPGPRVPPPLSRAGGEGVSHVQTFPGAEPSRLSARSPRPPPAPQRRPPCAWEPPGPPRAERLQRVTASGAKLTSRKGLGRGRTASTRGPGPWRSRRPSPCATGAWLPGPSQRRGPGREIPHGVSVCARVCVCVCEREVVQRPGAPRGRLQLGDTHGCGHLGVGGRGEPAYKDPVGPTSSTPLSPGRRVGWWTGSSEGPPCPLP